MSTSNGQGIRADRLAHLGVLLAHRRRDGDIPAQAYAEDLKGLQGPDDGRQAALHVAGTAPVQEVADHLARERGWAQAAGSPFPTVSTCAFRSSERPRRCRSWRR